MLYRRGKLREAAPVLERSWRLSQEGEIAAHYGEVLWKSGEQAQARAIWARALVTSPESKPLRATIERLTGKPTPPAAPVPSLPADAPGTSQR